MLFLLGYKYRIVMYGQNVENISQLRYKLFMIPMKFIIRSCLLLTFNVYSCKLTENLFDYKEYLGEDWKPTYQGTSTICCNHISWMVIRYIV